MQMEFETLTHEPVTPMKVISAIYILLLDDYESLCRFLEPKTAWERQIIKECLESQCELLKARELIKEVRGENNPL